VGPVGPAGATGTLSSTFFEFDAFFNNGGDAGSDLYFSPVGTTSNNGAPSPAFGSANLMVVPLACTMNELNVGGYVSGLYGASPGASVITLYHGVGTAAPTATAITCTTGATGNSIGSFSSCSDTTHTVALAAGDLLTLKLHDPNNSSSTNVVQYGVHLRCQ
jgi:hypothetical protein